MSDGGDAPGVNAVIGQSGACPEITNGGKVWKVGYPTQEAKTILNNLIVKQASDEIEAKGKLLGPTVSSRLFDAFVSQIQKKHFHTWHPGWLEAMGGQDGDILFLLSLLKLNHPEATEADARSLYAEQPNQVKVAIAQVMPPFFDLLAMDFPPQVATEQRASMLEEMRSKYLLPPDASS